MHYSPITASPGSGQFRGPLVERVAAWSAAHRKTAVFGWLALVIAAAAIGQLPALAACRATIRARPARPNAC